ncbi:hypothetical protein H8356DRAFT_1374309 [Neocallimastix lanati (nom. inval.)]|nr:hypothetical protein H8356DRAFT_1374309 [Neocallimastix sp. JGI-2020a]
MILPKNLFHFKIIETLIKNNPNIGFILNSQERFNKYKSIVGIIFTKFSFLNNFGICIASNSNETLNTLIEDLQSDIINYLYELYSRINNFVDNSNNSIIDLLLQGLLILNIKEAVTELVEYTKINEDLRYGTNLTQNEQEIKENEEINFNNFKFDEKFRIKRNIFLNLNELIKNYLSKNNMDKESNVSKIIDEVNNLSRNDTTWTFKNININDQNTNNLISNEKFLNNIIN